MKKRILSVLLAAVMLLTLLPFSALAVDSDGFDSAKIYQKKDGSFVLVITVSDRYNAGQNIGYIVVEDSVAEGKKTHADLDWNAAAFAGVAAGDSGVGGMIAGGISNDALNAGTKTVEIPLTLKFDATADDAIIYGSLSGKLTTLVWEGTDTLKTDMPYAEDTTITNGTAPAYPAPKEDLAASDFTLGEDKVYNAFAQTPAITPPAGVTAGDITIKYDGSTTAPTTVGTYAITIDVAETTGYKAATGLSLGNWKITKATPDVEISAPKDAALSVTSGDARPSISGTASINSGATNVPGSIAWDNTAADVKITNSTKAQAWTFTPNDTDNYNVKKGTINFTIAGLPTETATIADLTYTGQVQTPTVTYGTPANADKITVTYTPSEIKNIGTYTATFETSSEEFNAPADVTFKVLAKSVTLALNTAPLTATEGEITPATFVKSDDFVTGENANNMYGSLTTAAGVATAGSDAGSKLTVTYYKVKDGIEIPDTATAWGDITVTPAELNDDGTEKTPAVKATQFSDVFEAVTENTIGAGTYYVTVAATDAGDEGNYNLTAPLNASTTNFSDFTKLTVSAKPTSSGGFVSSDFTVTYAAGAHGTINGATSEKVKRNESPVNVPTVTANKGYAFIGWSLDGKTIVNPAAQTITKNTTFTALYGDHLAYMVGRSTTEFVPNGNLTRAEAAAILSRLTEGFEEDGTYPAAPYSDLTAGAWYVKYVNFAADKGIVNGRDNGTFDPDANITRAEFATMIANFAKIAKVDTAAVSTDVAGHWAEGYIAALEQAKVVTGYEDGTFKPNANITRAEAATMVNGAIGRVPMSELDLAANGYVNPFVDVTTSQWFYAQVMEAGISHLSGHFHK